MEILGRKLPPDHDIITWGDTHLGTTACSEGTVKEIVGEICKKRKVPTYTTHVGDAVEAKLVDSKHFQAEVHDAKQTPIVQMERFCSLVKRIKPEQWLAIHWGNHELKHHRFGNLIKDIACERTGAPYGGFTAKHIITNSKTGLPMYRMLTTHGSKVARSTNNDPHDRRMIMERQVKRSLAVLGHGDCVLNFCGHGHKLVVVRPMHEPYFSTEGREIIGHYTEANHEEGWIDEDLRYYAMVGAQFKTLVVGGTTYAEMAGYGPAELGYVITRVRGGKIESVEPVHLGHV